MGARSVQGGGVSAHCSMNGPSYHDLKRRLLEVLETKHPHGLNHLSPPLAESFALAASETLPF